MTYRVLVGQFAELLEEVNTHPDFAANTAADNRLIAASIFPSVIETQATGQPSDELPANPTSGPEFEAKTIVGVLEDRRKEEDGRFVKYIYTIDGAEYATYSEAVRKVLKEIPDDSAIEATLERKKKGQPFMIAGVQK